MASSKQSRENKRRQRAFEARVAVNDRQQRRRKRDNVAAGITLAVVALLAGAAQVFFFVGGPGAPVTEPVATETTSAETPAATAPDPALAEGRTWTGTMTFNGSLELGIDLNGAAAPQAVANMISLSQSGYYDDTACHRLTTEGLYVLQCGDPEGTGQGGPGYTWGPIENAPADGVYPAGTIAMARTQDPNSMGSQFFIVYEDTTLPTDGGGYTIFGTVTSGLDELRSQIVAQGVQGGASDGAPVAPAVITGISLS
ncbi:peptidyl-prolyl cis-trans isomerase B (cyclophilin B) [Pseudoclavibacter chungangensis]|uniref:peptidylprolyl isomerase n=1 Tax=Pseudoclavibacter chungangensis TaxID=587635 RepID=UPI0017ADFF36|nr:peptidylprolyl isomerase [Pseudoclavibacter chungangensis]NYJ66530.1 peptidyl-prolyl cis-trans isomerase B (cyclophilin B) [Pseudoclavibacter chungangensis]